MSQDGSTTAAIAGAIATGLGGITTGLFALFKSRQSNLTTENASDREDRRLYYQQLKDDNAGLKEEAHAASLRESANDADLREQVNFLQSKLISTEERLADMALRVESLSAHVRDLGGQP